MEADIYLDYVKYCLLFLAGYAIYLKVMPMDDYGFIDSTMIFHVFVISYVMAILLISILVYLEQMLYPSNDSTYDYIAKLFTINGFLSIIVGMISFMFLRDFFINDLTDFVQHTVARTFRK
jgi:hypothetical protein